MWIRQENYFIFRISKNLFISPDLSEKKLHKTGRIDQVIRDYFATNKTVKEIQAKDIMPLLIEKGIFAKDNRKGFPIRALLRELDAAGKLDLITNFKVVRNLTNRNWYFIRK